MADVPVQWWWWWWFSSATSSSSSCVLSLSVIALSGLTFAFFIALRLPPGLPRLLCLLPFLPAFFLLPSYFPSPIARGTLSFILCWTCPSKLLLLCFDRFLDPPPWLLSHFSHFLAAFLLPVRVKGPAAPSKDPATALSRFSGLWYALATVCLFNLYSFQDVFPRSIIYALHCTNVFLGLQLQHCLYAGFMHACFKVELDPAFSNPFRSSSLREFWGKRWNITVITILRQTVYIPVLRFLSSKNTSVPSISKDGKQDLQAQLLKPRLWARARALWATFLVSGLMHELIYFCFTKSEPTWEVTAFFVLHGFATSAEVAFRRVLPQHLSKVPAWVSVPLTLSFIYATAIWLFLPPLCNSETDLKCIAEYHHIQNRVLKAFLYL